MELVIVESSTKAITISKYLESLNTEVKYVVQACSGHVCDIIKDNYGFKKDTYVPEYYILPKSKLILKRLKQIARKSKMVWIASDNDREGETIAWHLKTYLKLEEKNYRRIVFNEITKASIISAMNNPRTINENIVNAQQARRVIDRVIGFSLTKQLYTKFSSKHPLSAGRVQSVVLSILADRENFISKHIARNYWVIKACFDTRIGDSKLYKNKKLCKIGSESDTESTIKSLSEQCFQINRTSSCVKQITEYPEPAFTTSTLQQQAYNELSFSIGKTMELAQLMYEKGFITYMRTDSTYLSSAFIVDISNFIGTTYNIGYINTNKIELKSQKNSQEAHGAIRPTNIFDINIGLSPDQKKLYNIIHKRTLASQMIPAIYDELTVKHSNIEMDTQAMFFLGKTRVLVLPGYKIMCDYTKTKMDLKVVLDSLSSIPTTLITIIGNHVHSPPPTRYNESSIIKNMEQLGIGRPSTYVSVLSKLYDRNYVNTINISGPLCKCIDISYNHGTIKKESYVCELYVEKNKLIATDIGQNVVTYLKTSFSEIIDVGFTCKLEEDLDKIASCDQDYLSLVEPFVIQMNKTCARVNYQEMIKKQRSIITDGIEYIIREAKFGPVIEVVCGNNSLINLNPYFKFTNKTIDNLDKSDINLIISMPLKTNGNFVVKYARFGFYVIDEISGKSKNIPSQYWKNMLKADYSFIPTVFISRARR
jgi:DNA topoisomerase-1